MFITFSFKYYILIEKNSRIQLQVKIIKKKYKELFLPTKLNSLNKYGGLPYNNKAFRAQQVN